MNNVDNKELLLAAIDDYNDLTHSQKELLKVLVNFNTEVSAQTIIDVIALRKQSVYPNLKKLLASNLITKIQKRTSTFLVNRTKMYEIVEFYNKKQEILQNNSIKYLTK